MVAITSIDYVIEIGLLSVLRLKDKVSSVGVWLWVAYIGFPNIFV